jgi:hypothetical protein
MTTDNIIEIGIDDQERLYVKPEKEQFNLIWRTATEVHWDQNGKFLYSPKPREWSYLEWYKHILETAYSECNCELLLTSATKWTNIAPELEEQIVAYRENAMKVNFMVEESYAIVYEGTHVDLHNNFHLSSYHHDSDSKTLSLVFKKNSGDWVHDSEFESIILVHKQVSFLNIINAAEGTSIPPDTNIEDLSFFPSSLRDVNDGIILQAFPENGDDIIYSFSNDMLIRVGCDEIKLFVDLEVE